MEIEELKEQITKIVNVQPGHYYVVCLVHDMDEAAIKMVIAWFSERKIEALFVTSPGLQVLEVSPSDTTTTSTS